ncbi:DUF3320 domain-containing protein [Cellulomonas sp. S1-8]|uniref:DUF3320 domain-containing protein n=1 Tax=Cellulomonas sp. S1-8 TaxID=2904790 RepID=UPI0022444C28|nr:DUF3320 domain-containing protein [Cellulomonas sp. S1-8]UZN03050.1 DUF3320 domain-containing protein [Cellulomonas sp. S1-8]
MTDRDHHSDVGEALTLLVEGLAPYVTAGLTVLLPEGASWTELLRRKDAIAGRRDREYHERDLALLLRAMTERLGELGYPFSRTLSRQGQAYASELRDVRNRWAHHEPFTAATAFRALDSAELLLREIGADQADAVGALKSGLLPPPDAAATTTPLDTADDDGPAAPSGGTTIQITALPVLSYAMAHSRIGVIDEITVTGVAAEARGASLEVDVVCATGSLGGPKVHLLDLAAGQPTMLRSVDLVLDPARMLAVDEQQPGQIRTVLRDAAGTVLATGSVDVQILASNQWMARPPHLALEMLAAHVQPNAAAIAPLMVEASDLLRAATGRSALDGYQSEDPERVDATAAAIYDAIRARDVRYAEPPASWGDVGQKVRTPAEVLEGRLGTCLDTTVTYAAALEQAGINPTLWLFAGHVLVGYWRQESTLGMVATPDVADIVNLVDLGLIGLVETTALAGGVESKTFDVARRAGKNRLAGDLSQAVGVTDVRQARLARIFPLPSRSVGADGQVVVHEYAAGAGPTIEAYRGAPSQGTADDRRDVPARVSRWKNSLLDLSLRNRLIHYTDRAGFRLEVPGQALARLEDQISAGVTITLVSSDAVAEIDAARGIRFGRDLPEDTREVLLADKRAAYIDITSASYTSKLRYLTYKAKTIVEETGSNNLYLAFGMLSWRFNDRDLRSPLVLVPVQLSTTSRGQTYRIKLDEAGASTPNYCLLEKLRVSFGLEIPGLAEPGEDSSGIDLPAAFDAVRRAIAVAGLPFRVEETVDLAILQFAKFPLWKDLDQHWETLTENALVHHLVHTPLDAFIDPTPPPQDVDLDLLGAAVPVPADSSQLEAVADAVAGRTFVLEGPPGTGKSQTITNLLARALAEGRRVLFVAEKRAALDVVKKRLEAVGLSHLSLDLHDKGARPAAVRAQLRAALELRATPDVDALRAGSETAAAARRRLATYAARLHEQNAAGHSLYSARSFELASEQAITPLDVPAALVAAGTPEQLDEVRSLLRDLPEVADLARPRPRHPWRFVDVRPDAPFDVAAVHAAALRLDAAIGGALDGGLELPRLGRLRSADDATAWLRLADTPRYPLTSIATVLDSTWRPYLQRVRAGADALAGGTGAWRQVVAPAVMQRDVAAIHAAALAADASGFFGRKKRRRAVLAQFADTLVVPPSEVPLKQLSDLTADLATTYAQVTELRALVTQTPLPFAADGWNPGDPAAAAWMRDNVDTLTWLGEVLAVDGSALRDDLRAYYSGTPQGTSAAVIAELADAWSAFDAAVAVDRSTLERWAGDDGFLTVWWVTRTDRRLESAATLERWADLVRHVEPLRRHGMDAARTEILDGRVAPDDAVLAFDRGAARTSLAERAEATALGDFDVAAHNRTIERFTQATRAVRAELPQAIPDQVLALRRFDVTSGAGQIGGLVRQLKRERGGMTVRALMEHYGELITEIMPCTLMSPESVARFFPARPGLFDVVVFDEASQIRVADAIGAMGRASSVVVVGDSKQMPPTQVAETSASVEDEEDVTVETVVDEESILSECVQSRVPSKWLSWHYRSQDESLIAFSNRLYYEDRLSSFPAPLPGDTRQHPAGYGISLVRVDGKFERSGKGKALRTNPVEADAIVADVRARFAASPGRAPSLGVITFNAQQRDLIDNLLRDSGDDRIVAALDEADGLFVKNLENVQGDERDCILFSVAFSANDRGVVPLNFGPLSKPGGERRLNVAVTRARRQVVLYASFAPEALRAEESTQVGTKHLRAYLEMAAHGVEVAAADGRRRGIVDHHRDDLAAKLRLAGYAVRTDVGLSDFRVDVSIAAADDPDQPLVAVLLDGPTWHARRTVADRDGLPVEVLQGIMRWPGVERVWLPEWVQQREETLARLAGAVERAREVVRAAAAAVEGADFGTPEVDDLQVGTADAEPWGDVVDGVIDDVVDDDAPITALDAPAPGPRRHPAVRDHVEWAPGRLGTVATLDGLASGRTAAEVRAAIVDAIAVEGPIHPDRLTKIVAGAYGLGRVGEERKAAITRLVPVENRTAGDDFYWPAGVSPQAWLDVRRAASGVSRPVEEVSLVEIANAMRVAAEETGGASADELKRRALLMFGGKRVTEAIGKRLDAGLEVAVEWGRVQVRGAGMYVSGG